MEVRLSPAQELFIRQAMESGRFREPQNAVQEALAMWEDRERRRAELIASLDEAEASLARGEGITLTQESAKEFTEDVKMRGRLALSK